MFWYFKRYHIQFMVRYYRGYVCVSIEINHLGLKGDSLQKGLVFLFIFLFFFLSWFNRNNQLEKITRDQIFSKTGVKVKVLVPQSCPSLLPRGLQPASPFPWNSPSKNTGVSYHFPHQGIFPTQGLNHGTLHHMWFLYHLNHQGSLK